MLAPVSKPVFLADNEADVAFLQKHGATAWRIGERLGISDDNIILVARGDGRDRLRAMNLGLKGRFVDLGHNGSLSAYMIDRGDDPIAWLNHVAQDIFWHEERPLSEWAVPELVQGKPSGFEFLDAHLRWTCPELVILVGPYGCGKSNLARLLAYQWANAIGRNAGHRASLVGWEDKLSTIKREIARYSKTNNVKTADMEGRVGWTQRHPDDARLLQWYLDLVEHRAKRDGVRFFVFDPFNEHDSTRAANQTETEYVRDMMIKFRKLVHGLGIIMIVVTHVSAKSYAEDGSIKPFRLAQASGSVQFGNKADRGICVLRTSTLRDYSSVEIIDESGEFKRADDHMLIHFDKAKDEEIMGKRGTMACVFDPREMSLIEDKGATLEARKTWP